MLNDVVWAKPSLHKLVSSASSAVLANMYYFGKVGNISFN